MTEAIVINLPDDIPDYLKNPVIFHDRNHGVAMVATWEGVDWLFVRINNAWVSKRKITTHDRIVLDTLRPLREG